MILHSADVGVAELEAHTGWVIKPEGACKGDVCVPLPGRRQGATVDVAVLAERLGMPVVHDEAHGVAALGPETALNGRALSTAQAPDLVLPDLDGRPFRVASLRPAKVVLVAWASW